MTCTPVTSHPVTQSTRPALGDGTARKQRCPRSWLSRSRSSASSVSSAAQRCSSAITSLPSVSPIALLILRIKLRSRFSIQCCHCWPVAPADARRRTGSGCGFDASCSARRSSAARCVAHSISSSRLCCASRAARSISSRSPAGQSELVVVVGHLVLSNSSRS